MTMLPLINYNSYDWRPRCLFDYLDPNNTNALEPENNIYLSIWLAPYSSLCNYFLVFDIALIR